MYEREDPEEQFAKETTWKRSQFILLCEFVVNFDKYLIEYLSIKKYLVTLKRPQWGLLPKKRAVKSVN